MDGRCFFGKAILGMQQIVYHCAPITSTTLHWNCVWFYGIWLIVITINLSIWLVIHFDIVIGEFMINWRECGVIVILKCDWHFNTLLVVSVYTSQSRIISFNWIQFGMTDKKVQLHASVLRIWSYSRFRFYRFNSIQRGFSICYSIQSTINHTTCSFHATKASRFLQKKKIYLKWSHCKLPHKFSLPPTFFCWLFSLKSCQNKLK